MASRNVTIIDSHAASNGQECLPRRACATCLAVRASRAAASALLTTTATVPTTLWSIP